MFDVAECIYMSIINIEVGSSATRVLNTYVPTVGKVHLPPNFQKSRGPLMYMRSGLVKQHHNTYHGDNSSYRY